MDDRNHSVDNAASEQEKRNHALGRTLKALFFPISAVIGSYVTVTEVRGKSNKAALEDGSIADLSKTHAIHAAEIRDKRLNKGLDLAESLELEAKNRRVYRKAVDARMRHLGRGDFVGRMKYLSRSARQQCIIDGITAGAIALGALFSISNSKVFSEMLGMEDKPQDNHLSL